MTQGAKGYVMPRKMRALAFAMLVASLVGIVGLILFMSRISDLIERQRIAISGNLTWEIAELEVDLDNFSNSVLRAQLAETEQKPDALNEVRQSFDILYSRVTMLANPDRQLGGLPEGGFMPGLREVNARLVELAPIIDEPDDGLDRALPQLSAVVEGEHPDVRNAILKTFQGLVFEAEQKRLAIVRLLTEYNLLALLLIVILFLAIYALQSLMRAAQSRARESERISRQLRSTIEASLDAVIHVGKEGQVLQYNNAAKDIFGIERAHVIGRRLSQIGLIDELAAICERWRAGRMGDQAFVLRREVLTGRRAGAAVPLEATIAVIDDVEGGQNFVCFLHDISGRLEAEENLRQARDAALASEQAKSRFLAVVSHEMRTPLTGMIAALDMAAETAPPVAPGGADFLRMARRSAMTALEQVNDLLELTRLNQADLIEEVRCFDLVSLLNEIAEQYFPLAIENGTRIQIRAVGFDFLEIRTSRRLISRILANLLSNATKFTRLGQIDLTAGIDRAGGQPVLTLSVRDTGIGIAPELQERIFENFETGDTSYTRSHEGTGLGLGIVRLAVERLGGTVVLASRPGEGSTFTIRVPVEVEPAAVGRTFADATVPGAGPGPVAPPRMLEVLLAEDNEVNRLLLGHMVVHLGHRVRVAQNGAEAVSMTGEYRFDVVLMDVSMPVMDGLEATRRIRARQHHQPHIVGLTAHVMPQVVVECRSAGMDGVEIKPVTLARLREILTALVAKAGDTPGPAAVDEQVFGEALHLMGVERFREVVRMVQEESRALLDGLEQSWRDFAQPDLVRRLHRLAGSTGMIGASRLASALSETEQALILRTEQDIAAQVSKLETVWRETVACLDQRLSEPRGPRMGGAPKG